MKTRIIETIKTNATGTFRNPVSGKWEPKASFDFSHFNLCSEYSVKAGYLAGQLGTVIKVYETFSPMRLNTGWVDVPALWVTLEFQIPEENPANAWGAGMKITGRHEQAFFIKIDPMTNKLHSDFLNLD